MSCYRRTSALFTAALLAACVDPSVGRDRDNDGFETWELGGDDCDDANANVNPTVSELCGNGIDDDCDGFIDDDGVGARSWFVDADGDGFAADTEFVGCSAPPGSLSDLSAGVDCNDDDRRTYPGAPEVWYDGIDQACDGGNDYDADNDGFDGVQGGGDDCEDLDATVNPDSVEICGNGLDDDCDATPNHCVWTGEVDVEDIASSVLPVKADRIWVHDYTGDGVDDVLVYDGGSAQYDIVGHIELYAGPLGAAPAPVSSWTLPGTYQSSSRVLADQDLDGDGLPDIITTQSDGSAANDRVIVAYLSPHQGRTQPVPDYTFRMHHEGEPASMFVHQLMTVEDIGSDSRPELLVAAEPTVLCCGGAGYEVYEGATWLVESTAFTSSVDITSAESVQSDPSLYERQVPLQPHVAVGQPIPGLQTRNVPNDPPRFQQTVDMLTMSLSRPASTSPLRLSSEVVHADLGDLNGYHHTNQFDLTGDGVSDWFLSSLYGFEIPNSGAERAVAAVSNSEGITYISEGNLSTFDDPDLLHFVAETVPCQFHVAGPPALVRPHWIVDTTDFSAYGFEAWVTPLVGPTVDTDPVARVLGAHSVLCPGGTDAIFFSSETETFVAVPQGI